jgi:hypothetical protein
MVFEVGIKDGTTCDRQISLKNKRERKLLDPNDPYTLSLTRFKTNWITLPTG